MHVSFQNKTLETDPIESFAGGKRMYNRNEEADSN